MYVFKEIYLDKKAASKVKPKSSVAYPVSVEYKQPDLHWPKENPVHNDEGCQCPDLFILAPCLCDESNQEKVSKKLQQNVHLCLVY